MMKMKTGAAVALVAALSAFANAAETAAEEWPVRRSLEFCWIPGGCLVATYAVDTTGASAIRSTRRSADIIMPVPWPHGRC